MGGARPTRVSSSDGELKKGTTGDKVLDPSLTIASLKSLSAQPMTLEPYYETMYILRPDIPEEEVESHVTKYRDMLVEAGAEVLDNQMRGKRRLAYPITALEDLRAVEPQRRRPACRRA